MELFRADASRRDNRVRLFLLLLFSSVLLAACGGRQQPPPWMRSAADEFLRSLRAHPCDSPRIALFSNAANRVRDCDGARQALAVQIASTVRWDECMENIHARRVGCVLEIGPGQALARMWNERYPGTPARSCDEFRSVAGIAKWVRGSRGG